MISLSTRRQLVTSRAILAMVLAMLTWHVWAQQPAPAPPVADAEATAKAEAARLQAQAENQASLADGLFRRHLYQMAAVEYQTLITKYPTFKRVPDAHLLLSECFRRQGQLAEAEKVSRKLILAFPDHSASRQALLELMKMLIEAKRADDALKLYGESPLDTMDALDVEAMHYYAGQAWNLKNELDKALAEFAHIPRNSIDDKATFRPFAQLTSGLILRAKKQDAAASPLLLGLADDPKAPGEVRQEALYHLAEIHYAAEESPQAIAFYARLVKEFPQSTYLAKAKLGMGWSYLRTEQFQEILKLFTDIDEHPLSSTGDDYFLLGSAQKELRMFEAALETYQQLVTRYPGSHFRPYAEVAVVECAYFLKDYTDCAALGEALIAGEKVHQFELEISQFLGQSYIQLGNNQKVTEVYERLLTRHADKLDNTYDLIILLARAYEQDKKYAEAARTYRRILDLAGEVNREQALILAAENEMKANNFERASADYEVITRTYPDGKFHAMALVGMAEAQTQLGKTQRAIELLDLLLRSHPDSEYKGSALYLRGSLHFRIGNTNEAIADLAASLNEPTFGERDFARLFLAYALWDAGKEGEALRLFSELLQMPGMEKNFTPRMLKEIGAKYLEKNSIASAEKAYSLLAAVDEPTAHLNGLIGLGKTEYLKGKTKEANAIFEKLRNDAPAESEQYVIALAYLGETFRLLGKNDRAFLAFQDGIRLGTKDTDANALLRVGIARIFYGQKRYEEALSKANAAYILFGDTKYAPQGALLVCRILTEQGKVNDARIVLKELSERYPVAFEAFKQQPANADLFKTLDKKPAE